MKLAKNDIKINIILVILLLVVWVVCIGMSLSYFIFSIPNVWVVKSLLYIEAIIFILFCVRVFV